MLPLLSFTFADITIAIRRIVETVNGLLRGTSGTFVWTLTGVTATVEEDIVWTREGPLVHLVWLSEIEGTSNTTACTLTGLPQQLWPARNQTQLHRVTDNGVTAVCVTRIETDGTFRLFSTLLGTGFTASGAKGIRAGTLSYSLL
jgi:hypothetical protein